MASDLHCRMYFWVNALKRNGFDIYGWADIYYIHNTYISSSKIRYTCSEFTYTVCIASLLNRPTPFTQLHVARCTSWHFMDALSVCLYVPALNGHTYCMVYVLKLVHNVHCVASYPSYLCCLQGMG